MTTPHMSALIVTVPEAESAVGEFRLRHDSSAARGLPPHLTVLCPFKSPTMITKTDHETLAGIFTGIAQFPFCLHSVATFPNLMYLAPDVPEAFVTLTTAVVKAYPDYPPYGGAFETVVPHLTVAETGEPQLSQLVKAFGTASVGRLPIRAIVRDVWLYAQDANGRWEPVRPFPLGQTKAQS